jgi:hypothetical protein
MVTKVADYEMRTIEAKQNRVQSQFFCNERKMKDEAEETLSLKYPR